MPFDPIEPLPDADHVTIEIWQQRTLPPSHPSRSAVSAFLWLAGMLCLLVLVGLHG